MKDPLSYGMLWIVAAPMALLLFLAFRKKGFGVFDPLNWFLMSRIVPLLVCGQYLIRTGSFNSYGVLFLLGSFLFLVILFLSSPTATPEKLELHRSSLQKLIFVGIFILVTKIAILTSASGELPIFSKGGSDAYIDFDLNNKLSSSILLGLGTAELVLLSFALPLLAKWRPTWFIVGAALLLSIVMSAATGKKSSMLSAVLAIALGEYLRMYLLENQKKYFLTTGKMAVALTGAVSWAIWIFSNTVGSDVDMDVQAGVNFVIFNWEYPFLLFSSGEMEAFFQAYQVNELTYLFHSVLSPLGFPAFHTSVGPALHEYQSGELTGNGINPTFVIEGYVLVGILMPLYAAAVAYAVGRARVAILSSGSLFRRVTLSAFLLYPLYIMPIDMLLFMKIFFVAVAMFVVTNVGVSILSVRRC